MIIESINALTKKLTGQDGTGSDITESINDLTKKWTGSDDRGETIAEALDVLTEHASSGSGGGGGGYPTVTVNVSSEKLYCSIQFQPDLNPETESNEIVNALYNNGSYYMDQCNLEPDAVDSGVTADFLMIGDSFTLIPWADFDNPDAVTITGSATFDNETNSITVTGDCSIHLIGFDE